MQNNATNNQDDTDPRASQETAQPLNQAKGCANSDGQDDDDEYTLEFNNNDVSNIKHQCLRSAERRLTNGVECSFEDTVENDKTEQGLNATVENRDDGEHVVEEDSQLRMSEEYTVQSQAKHGGLDSEGELVVNYESQETSVVPLANDCQNTVTVDANDDCSPDKTNSNNNNNHDNSTDIQLTRGSSAKENIAFAADNAKEKDEVFKDNPTTKRLEKQMEKRKQRKSSRTKSVDDSLAEDERNRPSDSTSNVSQQGSSISEVVFKSPTFQTMLQSKEFRYPKRRQAIEKSVNKVANWLVESDSNLEESEHSCRAESDFDSNDDGVEPETASKVYSVVDVTDDKVIYYDSDPSDASFSGGVLKESNLLSCTMVLPYFCTKGGCTNVDTTSHCSYRKTRSGRGKIDDTCKGDSHNNTNGTMINYKRF